MEFFQSKQNKTKRHIFIRVIFEIEKASCSTSRIGCVKEKGGEEKEREAGIPLSRNPVFGTLLCGNTVCATLSFHLSSHKTSTHTDHTHIRPQ